MRHNAINFLQHCQSSYATILNMNSIKHITISGDMKKQLLRLPWLLLIPLGFLLPTIASTSAQSVERVYSSAIYPVISSALSAFTGLFGFSVGEFFVYFVVLGTALTIILSLTLTILKRIPLVRFIAILITLLIIAGILLNLFYILWGFNYMRPSLYTLMDMKNEFHPVKALERLCIQLVNKANELRPYLVEDEHGVFMLSGGVEASLTKLQSAYDTLGSKVALFGRQKAAKAKPVLYSNGLSNAGIAGIYFPFTAEPNINIEQPALLIPSSAAHEMAHYLGFAREDEANFISFLACMASDDPEIRYSGIMLALITCANELYSCDKAAYTRLYKRYSTAMIRDISNYDAYWDSFKTPVREAATKINDSYLKSNMQSTGVKSYNQMVELMLAYYTNLPEL